MQPAGAFQKKFTKYVPSPYTRLRMQPAQCQPPVPNPPKQPRFKRLFSNSHQNGSFGPLLTWAFFRLHICTGTHAAMQNPPKQTILCSKFLPFKTPQIRMFYTSHLHVHTMSTQVAKPCTTPQTTCIPALLCRSTVSVTQKIFGQSALSIHTPSCDTV